MKKILLILFLFLIITGCSEENNEQLKQDINGKQLKNLVENALQGDVEANVRLSDLVNPDTHSPNKVNQLVIDSTVSFTGVKLYSVLLEYPNPLYNLLAVYDNRITLLLLDNSLNGNIAVEWKTFSGKLYLVASENFIVKDKIKLSRLSLYSTENEKVDLVFRTFTRCEIDGNIYTQNIENMSSIAILTRLSSSTNTPFNNKSETFTFNSDGNEYLSSSDVFTRLVLSEIKNADWQVENPVLIPVPDNNEKNDTEISSESSIDVDSIHKEFKISLNDNWEEPVKIKVTNHLISELDGIRFINEKLGAQITLLKVPSGSNSEDYIKYNFSSTPSEDYMLRTTELIKSGRNFIRFFEHSCSGKIFILLLQVPKYTYDENKPLYDKITSSFKIEC